MAIYSVNEVWALNACKEIGQNLLENGRDIGGSDNSLLISLKPYTHWDEIVGYISESVALDEVRRGYRAL